MTRPARITLLTSGPLCRNPRVRKEAETLALAGHAVTMVTIAYHRRFEAYDEELLGGARYRKIMLDRVSTRPAIRLFSFFERTLAYGLRRTRIEHQAALGPSHALASALAKAYAGPVPAVVPNTFTLSPRPDRAQREAVPAFLWLSQTVGPGRGLEAFIAAWTLTRSPSSLVLLGDISDAYRATLTALLPPAYLARFRILPLVATAELPALIGRHHVGLALEPAEPASRNLTITNKIFHYLDSGLAILAKPTAGQREVFAQHPEVGLLDDLTNPGALAQRLDLLLADPLQLARMGEAARAAAEHSFCWEQSSITLLATVNRALTAAPSRRAQMRVAGQRRALEEHSIAHTLERLAKTLGRA